jgi:hypothetical protein
MLTYLITIGLILALMGGWIAVERFYRRFARRHPDLGPYREQGGRCGGHCAGGACGGETCGTKDL